MIIYIDVLIAINVYINYFLIRGASLLLRREVGLKRRLIASFVGALMALVIFLPALPFWLSALLKVLSSIFMVWITFGKAKPPDMIINTLCFLLTSFVYSGLMLVLWTFCAPYGMFYRNGTAYFDIPVIAVAIFTALAYFIIRFIHYVINRRKLSVTFREITILSKGIEVKLEGIADTGNSLCDPFTGKPAIICSIDSISSIIPDNITTYLNGKLADLEALRLVPYSTILGDSLIPVFKADKIVIGDKTVDAVVGVCTKPMGTQCLFNPDLISL